MPDLVLPTASVHASFLAAMDEFVAEGAKDSQTAAWIELNAPAWRDPEAFETFVAGVIADAEKDRPRPTRHVPCTTMWWVDGEDYLGRIAIRHRLNDFLLEVGATSATTYAPRRGVAATRPRCCAAPGRGRRGWASTRPWSPATTTTSARSG